MTQAVALLTEVPLRVLVVVLMTVLSSCAMVTVESRTRGDYIEQVRGDVLTSGKLSEATQDTLSVVGLEIKACTRALKECSRQLEAINGVSAERRVSALAEMWTAQALKHPSVPGQLADDVALDAWLRVARYAYAYLFFTERVSSQRAFENRQTQVRDYYNYATERVGESLFRRTKPGNHSGDPGDALQVTGWMLKLDMQDFRLPGGVDRPDLLVAAASLRFKGLRSTYRRDGFGAELVARVPPAGVGDPSVVAQRLPARARDTQMFSEIPYVPVTLLLEFKGSDLNSVLNSQLAVVCPYSPDRQEQVFIHGQQVPLAGNFTAAYGLWLARSGFAKQSLRSMLGRQDGIDQPHLYLMQPYDPNRRVLLMLHGLASSPEAWVNVANEIMGDQMLRRHYQIWQVYYPTNVPIALNRAQIWELVEQTLHHFDLQGTARASQEMVLIGHSMGGVIGKLLVTDSGETVLNNLMADRQLDEARRARLRERLQPLLQFSSLPQVERAIFIAAPIGGTPMAESRLGRFAQRLVRLPVNLLEHFGDVLEDLAGEDGAAGKPIIPNAIDTLRDSDPFIRATAGLPVSPGVRYNTIIARKDPKIPLEQSDDGLVPYSSAHLVGAESEKIITSWHSVQETPQAILEIRRILHAQMALEGAD